MALIKTGSIVTQISGKVGGQSFGHGRGGSYLKNIGSYITNRSSPVLASRSVFASVSGYWRSLTTAQKTAWKESALLHPYTNRVAQTKYLSGFNYFMQVNVPLVTAGQDILEDPPGGSVFPEYEVNYLGIAADNPQFEIVGLPMGYDVEVEGHDWTEEGTPYPTDGYEYIDTYPVDADPFEKYIDGGYSALFGSRPASYYAQLRTRIIDSETEEIDPIWYYCSGND